MTVQSGWRSLGRWIVAAVLPAVLAFVFVGRLVPRVTDCPEPFVPLARLGDEHPALLGAGLYLLLSSLIAYWLPALDGERSTQARRRGTASLVGTVAVVAAAALLVRTAVVEPFRVSGASMLPGIDEGDRIAVNKLAYGPPFAARAVPRRGEIIVFDNPESGGPARLIKRVVGLPGDRIGSSGNALTINGWRVPSCDAGRYTSPRASGTADGRLRVEFLEDQAYLTIYQPGGAALEAEYEVGAGEAFVVGDHRPASTDSRTWRDGEGAGVPLATVVGRADWHLTGVHRDGRADWGRALAPLLGVRLHLENIDVTPLRAGIERCLSERPSDTSPPPPALAVSARGDSLP